MKQTNKDLITIPNGQIIRRKKVYDKTYLGYDYEYELPDDYYDKVVVPFVKSYKENIDEMMEQLAEEINTKKEMEIMFNDPIKYIQYMRDNKENLSREMGQQYVIYLFSCAVGSLIGVFGMLWIFSKLLGCN
jgi:hypothetical protein